MSVAPLVIAHRGASGYLPEHTLEGKALAYGQRADFLEQDVVATRDGELIVLHDVYLDCVTDVADRYPGRARDDGHFYAVDFDLRELRQLRVTERARPGTREALFPKRFPRDTLGFRIPTLTEEIELVRGLNRSTGRNVGIYPEIKDPHWHRTHGIDLAGLLLETLGACGYRSQDDPVFVQCFDADELRRIRLELASPLRLVQLVQANGGPPLTAPALAAIAEYADGVGVAYSTLVSAPADRMRLAAAPLAGSIRDAGLLLHPYTFRRDELPAYAESLEALLAFFFREVGADGVFCDHPDIAAGVRDSLAEAP